MKAAHETGLSHAALAVWMEGVRYFGGRLGVLRWIVNKNVALSRGMDRLFWPEMTVDGNRKFLEEVRSKINDGAKVADVGGGKSPIFSPEVVRARRMEVTGIDIDQGELDLAPPGAYDQVICADITAYSGSGCADYVVVQSLLEHVRDNRASMIGIASICRSGGEVSTFCPNRRAWFARINRILPEGIKRALLYAIYPHTREKQGFPAFYDRCTPEEMVEAMEAAGLRVERIETYFISSYFMFFFPLYFFWRIVNVPLMKVWPLAFCETFALHAIKPPKS